MFRVFFFCFIVTFRVAWIFFSAGTLTLLWIQHIVLNTMSPRDLGNYSACLTNADLHGHTDILHTLKIISLSLQRRKY